MTEWHGATRLGSPYEEEYNAHTGQWRHRPLQLGPREMFGELGYGDWIYGKAPN